MSFSELISINIGQWEYLIRIIIACICGGVIGFERSRRFKDAGIRTHIILALGSALVMIISKYGFFDFVDHVDYSRVAANIVNGISFLCAGVIFVRSGSVKGLTTAAGIWATAGVGMAIGSGMYFIGLACTLLIIIIQLVLHRFPAINDALDTYEVTVTLKNKECYERFMAYLKDNKIAVTSVDMKKKDDGLLKLKLAVRVPANVKFDDFMPLVNSDGDIIEFSVIG